MGARIRAARAADLARLGPGFAPELGAPSLWFPAALARAATGRGAVCVVERFWRGRPRVIGCGTLTLWPRGAELAELQIAPAWRGHGLGTQLIAALEAAARTLHAPQAELAVAPENARALRLYTRLGYTPCGTLALNAATPLRVLCKPLR